MTYNKQLLKQSHAVLFSIVAVLAIVVFNSLSAQTYDSGISNTAGTPVVTDFSGVSDKGSEARTTFNVIAEIVESSAAVLSETTEVLSDDGSVKMMGLAVSPPRLVFEGDVKTAVLTLTNIGSIDTVYLIQLENTVVDDDGKRKPVSEKELAELGRQGAQFADRMLKFAPRQVRLKPEEQQSIRVAVLAPKQLDDGEYRSELKFSWQADAEEIMDVENFSEKLASVTASVKKSVATETVATDTKDSKSTENVYVPLIVRKGELTATGELIDVQLESSEESIMLAFKIDRIGNRSINGDLLIYGLNSQNEKTGPLQTVRRIAVYPPNSQQSVSIDVSDAVRKAAEEIESLMIEYKGSADEGNAILATAIVKLLKNARVSADR